MESLVRTAEIVEASVTPATTLQAMIFPSRLDIAIFALQPYPKRTRTPMARFTAIPILAAILLGLAFPYTALAGARFGFVFLFLLMLIAGIGFDWERLRDAKRLLPKVLWGLFFLYIVFPINQWALARLWVTDKQHLFGLLFASLTPVAIVAPYFTRLADGDEDLSFLLLLFSTLICPILVPSMEWLLPSSGVRVDPGLLTRSMVLLVVAPVVVCLPFQRMFPGLRAGLRPYLAPLNIFCLSALIFILFGAASARLNWEYARQGELWRLLALAFVQDFGVLVAAYVFFRAFWSEREARAVAISLSMKNVAIAAGMLLFYDPRASIPASLVFIPHALLFSAVALWSQIFSRNVEGLGRSLASSQE